jgi:hypothetical protein
LTDIDLQRWKKEGVDFGGVPQLPILLVKYLIGV